MPNLKGDQRKKASPIAPTPHHCAMQEATLAPKTGLQKLRLISQRCVQSFRLMVGVQDYNNYLNHMRQHHPEQPIMKEAEFHRYCLDARFPSKAGKVGKCPC